MREVRTVQMSIFEFYSEHEVGKHLEKLSSLIDSFPVFLKLLEQDLITCSYPNVGRKGLSVESTLRCLILKQMLRVSYQQLSFLLSDSLSYSTFARVDLGKAPSRSALQAAIRSIRPETIEAISNTVVQQGFQGGDISLDLSRLDSTVVESNIAPPSDSQLLSDAIRVLSRLLIKSKNMTGIKIQFKDHRDNAKKLAKRIFDAKKGEKTLLYKDILQLSDKVMDQSARAIDRVRTQSIPTKQTQNWLNQMEHYRELAEKIIDQTQRRVVAGEKVPSREKIVSLFEPHTDIIVKGQRDVQYGHKVNLATDKRGLITCFRIEEGNPNDAERFMSMVYGHQELYGCIPEALVADGGYATLSNVEETRALGAKRVVFHKKKHITLMAMGVKLKTYQMLKNFRAGIEGNISELKRAFGLNKVSWKTLDGFKAYVWSSVLSYNLNRLAKMQVDLTG